LSYRDPRVVEWEQRLKEVFDDIDHEIEDEYGERYPLHPSRPERGETSSPSADGLFELGASFTPGFGSRFGRGYLVGIRLATLSKVPPDVIEEIEEKIAGLLEDKLQKKFPQRAMRVERDGHSFKILGDLKI
jgi:hypothetical protein